MLCSWAQYEGDMIFFVSAEHLIDFNLCFGLLVWPYCDLKSAVTTSMSSCQYIEEFITCILLATSRLIIFFLNQYLRK